MNAGIYVDQFGDASAYLTNEVRSYAATSDIVHYDNYWNEVNNDKNRDKNIELLNKMGLTEDELAMVNKISSISNNLIHIEEKAMNSAKNGDSKTAIALLYGQEYVEGITEIRSIIDDFNEAIQDRIEAKVISLYEWFNIFKIIAYIAVLGTLTIQIVRILFVIKELIKPMFKIKERMFELVDGKFNGELQLAESDDEVGQMVSAINCMTHSFTSIIADIEYLLKEMASGNFVIESSCQDKYIGGYEELIVSFRKINQELSDALLNINVSADQVDAGAGQVASAAQALSQGSTEQAA